MKERSRGDKQLLNIAFSAVEAPVRAANAEDRLRNTAREFRDLADFLLWRHSPLKNYPNVASTTLFETYPIEIQSPGLSMVASLEGLFSDGGDSVLVEHTLRIQTGGERYEISVASDNERDVAMDDLPSRKLLKKGIKVLSYLKAKYEQDELVGPRSSQ